MSQIKGYDTVLQLSKSQNSGVFNAILTDPWHGNGTFFIGRYLQTIQEEMTKR